MTTPIEQYPVDVTVRLQDACRGGDSCKCTLHDAVKEIERLRNHLDMVNMGQDLCELNKLDAKAMQERYLPVIKMAAKNLQTVARMPNAEYFSDLHNASVEAIRKLGNEK